MSQSPQYFAVSIGPIYATIKQARKTRELWTTSYLFSYLMANIYAEVSTITGCEVISPIPPSNTKALFGAGVFPDRLYGKMDDKSAESLRKAVQNAIEKVRVATSGKGAPDGFRGDGGRFHRDVADNAFWENYFRIVHVFVPQSEFSNSKGNILSYLNARLDTLELQPRFFPTEPDANGLRYLLDHPYRTSLTRDHLTPNEGSAYHGITGDLEKSDNLKNIERFPSTAEIASLQLHQLFPDTYQLLLKQAGETVKEAVDTQNESIADNDDGLEEFYRLIYESNEKVGEDNDQNGVKAFRKAASPRHKYYCIVHADGDNFGKAISALGANLGKINTFSGLLAAFATKAASIINQYGGKPVYIGGDDLVFFSPVVANDSEGNAVTVLDLIQKLNTLFKRENPAAGLGLPDLPTLSFGLTLSYYKFPLFEAHALSYQQLDCRAKKTLWNNGQDKDAIGFRLLKHSGSYFEGILPNGMLPEYNALIHRFLGDLQDPDDKPAKLLSSFAFKLRELEALVVEAVNSNQPALVYDGEEEATDPLAHLFENYFNEPIHREYHQELSLIKEFAREVFQTKGAVDQEPIDRPDNFYALLRLLDFITPKTTKNND